MKRKKLGRVFLAAAAALTLVLPTGASAAESGSAEPLSYTVVKDSAHATVSAGSYSYDCYATLYYGSTSKGCLWAIEKNKQDAPAALRAYLYQDGVAVETSDWKDDSSYIHFVNTNNRAVSGAIKVDGEYKLYHDSSKNTRTEGRSPAVEYAVASTYSILPQADGGEEEQAVTSYPVNKKGETYGSYLDRHTVGSAPDLISALGEGDIYGYVRLEDFAPEFDSLGELQIWQARVNENNKIPLYDLDGNVIGEFALGTTQETVDPDILSQVNELAGDAVPAAREASELAYVPNAYPTNVNGETYGSYLDRIDFGYAPELISVLGDHDKIGYVYTRQFRNAQHGDSLNVYDLYGNIIDTYSAFGSDDLNNR